MHHFLRIFTIVLFAFSLSAQENREIQVIGTDELVQLTELNNDTIYVINFWATWCKPCIEEMPYFEQLHDIKLDSPIKVVLVSLDFEDNLTSKVIPFVTKNNIKSEVLLMGNTKYQTWIDLINPDWSGSIPATLLRKGDEVYFTEKSFKSSEELLEFINQ